MTNKVPNPKPKPKPKPEICDPGLAPTDSAKASACSSSPQGARKFLMTHIIAGLMLALGLVLLAENQWQGWQRNQLITAVVQDAVAGHLVQSPLAIESTTLEQLSEQLDLLDFTLLKSLQVPELDRDLLGGSYFSLQGVAGAQLRLITPAGGKSTLFQVPFKREHFARLGEINIDQQPLLRFAKGLTVTLWEESGLLLVLVQSSDALNSQPTITAPNLTSMR